MRCLRRISLGALLACALGRSAFADEATICLASGQLELGRLGPDAQAGTVQFQIEESAGARIEITSGLPDLITSVEGPAGQILNESTIRSFGGEFTAYSSGSQPGLLVMPGLTQGAHQVFTFPSLGPGAHTVRFAAPSAPAGNEPIIVELTVDGAVAATLFTLVPTLPTGSSAILTAAVFEDAAPILTASVVVTVQPPTGAASTLTLTDDGVAADSQAGDGLYSGLFPVVQVGEHSAVAKIEGINSHGTSFVRTAATRLLGVTRGAQLTGSVSDHGVDDNANTLFDRVVLSQGVEVAVPGTYRLNVILATAGGKTLVGQGMAILPFGTGSITCDIGAEDFLAAGEDGPYTVTTVEVLFDGVSGVEPNDRISEGTQATHPYLLAEFEQPVVRLTGVNSDTAIDADGDGDYDVMEARVGLAVRVPGMYQYLARLDDPCGRKLESIAGQQEFPSGTNPEALVLQYDGHLIGARGISGAFAIVELSISGPGGALTVDKVAETSDRAAQQFDGYQPAPDCDADGTPDICALASGSAQDCNRNDRPDACDIASGAAGDCNENGIPDECEATGTFPPWSVPRDACRDAEPVCPGLTYVGSTVSATGDGATSCNGGVVGPDVWYQYRPVVSGDLTVSLCESHFNTVVSIHTACPGGPVNEQACDDDGCGGQSLVTTPVTAGTLYYIRVAGFGFRQGDFAMKLTGPACSPEDCNGNGQVDVCDLVAGTSHDCNDNRSPDECDLASGTSRDCDANGIPDECQIASEAGADCNGNGTLDTCDLASGTSHDCNANQRPDECDLATGASHDCNLNSLPDECDVVAGTSADCDRNGVPDECEVDSMADCNENGVSDACDIAFGVSPDCNQNASPDECEIPTGASRDCNLNDHLDECDVASGASPDCDHNGIPDECQGGVPAPSATAQDSCTLAQPTCPGVVYTGSTLTATTDGSSNCGSSDASPDVWYRYVPAASGTLTASLCGSTFDTVLSIHAGCPGSTENEFDCVDDACYYQSIVTIPVTAGTPYLIRVTGFFEDAGEFTLYLTGPGCTPGDCNANGTLDSCDLALGASRDCNHNAVPDECDIGRGGSSDCDGNGVPDECLGPPVLRAEPVAGGAVRLDWSALPAATRYDVVRGSLHALAVTSGDFTSATLACIGGGVTVTSLENGDSPINGDGFWYLVRGGNCAFAGTYDAGDAAQAGSRDAEIAAAAAACP